MKKAAVTGLLVLFVAFLGWRSTQMDTVELSFSAQGWEKAVLGNTFAGPQGNEVETKEPRQVAAVAEFVASHRLGWHDKRPRYYAAAAPTVFVALTAPGRHFELQLILPGEGMKAYLYNRGQNMTVWKLFTEEDQQQLFDLFGCSMGPNYSLGRRPLTRGN